MITITDKLETMTGNIEMLVQVQKTQSEQFHRHSEQIGRQSEQIGMLLDALQKNQVDVGAAAAATTPEEQVEFARRLKKPPPQVEYTVEKYPFRRGQSSEVQSMPRVRIQTTSAPVKGGNQDGNLEEGLLEPESFELTLPAKHTTAAQNLVNWPSIKALIPAGITTSYVIDEESGRGLLRLYGSGEGEDKHDGHEGAPSPANSHSSEGRRMDEETSSSSPHGVWGTGQFHAPLTSNHSYTARDHPGGVSPQGGLMLDTEAVDRYFRSYMANIHILHPFLEPVVLRQMIYIFKRKYSWDYRATQPTVATIGTKRKRETTDSPISIDEQSTPGFVGNRTQTRGFSAGVSPIEHSVANAIVLLVLALGKITSHREPLPGPATTTSLRTSLPYSALYTDLPMPMSAPTSPFHNQVNLNGTNNVAVSSPANPQGKNMDAIPGLAYFAKAADILGELPGGIDVSHIQANLLAGLYMGQLARILPSYFYINKACMAAQILIESTPYKEQTIKANRRNLINFAFWSCLQLESDIAAELELPLSGITRYESPQHKEMPTSVTLQNIPESSIDDDILRYYSYQIQLRLTMNSIHSTLYRSSKDQSTRPSTSMMAILDENLEDWRRMLDDWNWEDDDHESPNINVARMRGKYYGAKYIIWRPAVHYALLQGGGGLLKDRPSESPAGYRPISELTSPSVQDVNAGSFQDSEIPIPNVGPDLLEGARNCISAAICSTTVFDKVPRRLVVTNIFGTAHA
jgi:hypothetical protein